MPFQAGVDAAGLGERSRRRRRPCPFAWAAAGGDRRGTRCRRAALRSVPVTRWAGGRRRRGRWWRCCPSSRRAGPRRGGLRPGSAVRPRCRGRRCSSTATTSTRAVHVGRRGDRGRGVAGVAGAAGGVRCGCGARRRRRRRGRRCRRLRGGAGPGRRGGRAAEERGAVAVVGAGERSAVPRRRRRVPDLVARVPQARLTTPFAWDVLVGTTWHSVQAMAAERSRVFTRWAWWAPTRAGGGGGVHPWSRAAARPASCGLSAVAARVDVAVAAWCRSW